MPDITITVPTDKVPRVKAAVQALGPVLLGDEAPDDPENWTNPQVLTVAQAMLKRFLRDIVKQHEAEVAVNQAREAAIQSVDDDGVIP